jgi:hypothetical protein
MRSRWSVLLLIAISVAVSACGSSSPATSSAAAVKSVGSAIPAGQLGGPFTSASVGAAETALAQNGIATVADETSTTPLVALTGSLRMTFTEAQVRSMALQVSVGGGIVGSAIDATTAMPSGDPPFSYLLAAWITKTDTPAASMMRTIMGAQDWNQAPSVIFPTIAVPLFVSDVIAAEGSPVSSAFHRNSGAHTDLMDFASTPCTSVTTFIQNTLNTVFGALMLNAPSGSGVGASIGSFFVTIWDVAVSLAQAVVQGLIAHIAQAGLAAIEVAAGAAMVMSEVASYVTPWSIKITPEIQTVDAGARGTVKATVVTSGGPAAYPPAITDCAKDAMIMLPPLNGADLAGTWSATGAITATSPTSVTLDSSGSSTLSFCAAGSGCGSTAPTGSTTSCPGSGASGSGTPPDSGVASIFVTRPGIDGLKSFVDGILAGVGAAGTATSIVISLLQPMITSVEAELAPVDQDISGTALVNVSGGPSPVSTPSSCAPCMVGSWTQTNETISGTDVSGGAGGTYSISSTGQFVWNLNGSAPTNQGAQNLGSGTGTVVLPTDSSATSGTWTEHNLSGEVIAHLPDGVTKTEAYPVTFGTWTCTGNDMTVAQPTGDSTITFYATRDSG